MRHAARIVLGVPTLALSLTLARPGRADPVPASCRDECARAAMAEQLDRPAMQDDTGPFDPASMVTACEEACARFEAACGAPDAGRCSLDGGPPLYRVLKDKPDVHLGEGFHAIVETCTHLSTELAVLVLPRAKRADMFLKCAVPWVASAVRLREHAGLGARATRAVHVRSRDVRRVAADHR